MHYNCTRACASHLKAELGKAKNQNGLEYRPASTRRMDLSCGPAAVAMQAAPLHASLLAHVPGVVTSIRIPEGFGETLEFNYTDIRNALIPPSAYSEPAPKALQVSFPGHQTFLCHLSIDCFIECTSCTLGIQCRSQ